MNKGEVPIELIDISFESSLDYSSQQEMFKLDKKQLESQLPIQPNRSINIIIHISSIANFINPTNLNWENGNIIINIFNNLINDFKLVFSNF